AEDGIRYLTVTGVQTCALPISWQSALIDSESLRYKKRHLLKGLLKQDLLEPSSDLLPFALCCRREVLRIRIESLVKNANHEQVQIGRASCRERREMSVVAVVVK